MIAPLSPAEWEVIGLSLKVSLVAVTLTLPIAYALAWLLARRRFPGRVLLDALVHLPLVVPPVVTGYVLLLLFGRTGPVGQWLEASLGVSLVFRWTGAALAAAVMALPLMVRAMRLSIEAVDRRLVGAARTLGASRWQAFIDGIRAHEAVHAAMIHDLVRAIVSDTVGTRTENDPGCTKIRPLILQKVKAAYARHQARSRAFDRDEMGRGGNVEGLIRALVE